MAVVQNLYLAFSLMVIINDVLKLRILKSCMETYHTYVYTMNGICLFQYNTYKHAFVPELTR